MAAVTTPGDLIEGRRWLRGVAPVTPVAGA